MTRKIGFDFEQTLHNATMLFWQRGYAATGLRDLLKVMKIGEGSFYNSHKSKKRLYLNCLQHYQDLVVSPRIDALLTAPTAAAGIRAFFDDVLNTLDNPETPSRLCMVAAMEVEEVLAEAELRHQLQQNLSQLQTLMFERLRDDKGQGLLPATVDPLITAQVIITFLQGLWRMALLDYDRKRFSTQIDTLLTGLGL